MQTTPFFGDEVKRPFFLVFVAGKPQAYAKKRYFVNFEIEPFCVQYRSVFFHIGVVIRSGFRQKNDANLPNGKLPEI